MTPGDEGVVVSRAISPVPSTSRTSVRYLLLKAIFDSGPSTAASISPSLSPSSSARELMESLPPAPFSEGLLFRRTMPLPSLANIDAVRVALKKADWSTTARVSKESGISCE